MCAALRKMQEKGMLWKRPGAGIFAGQPAHRRTDRKPPIPNRQKAEAVRQSLLRDIFEGRFDGSPALPPWKQLTRQYGVCHATFRKVLKSLANDGIVQPQRSKFAVAASRPDRPANSVVLYIAEEVIRHLASATWVRSWLYLFVYALEYQCSLRNIRLSVRIVPGAVDPFAGLSDALGIIVCPSMYANSQPEVRDLLIHLSSYGKPVCTWDMELMRAFPELLSYRNLLFLRGTDYEGGRDTGRLLLSLGHRRVAFFTFESGDQWSLQRQNGLSDAFEAAGFPDAVSVYTEKDLLPTNSDPSILHGSLLNKRKKQHRYLARFMQHIGRHFDPSLVKTEAEEALRALDAHISGHWSRFDVLYRRALSNKGITAWVAGEDGMAIYSILPFLAARRINVPGMISVTGFSNMFGALSQNLTTYNFNSGGAAALALNCLLYPDQRRVLTKREGHVLEVQGHMVERGTTGPASVSARR
jgi:DNA-binding LacI/PurR family transcriptional regulator/DNA-binding transcriptional regulator YhcF (GntR family)